MKRGRPGGTVVGRMRIRVGMGVRGRVRVSRVRRRRRRWPLVEVRIILIHHLGTAHHPARARHPRAGLPTCVPERRTTRSYTIFSFHFVHFVLQSCSLSLSFSLSSFPSTIYPVAHRIAICPARYRGTPTSGPWLQFEFTIPVLIFLFDVRSRRWRHVRLGKGGLESLKDPRRRSRGNLIWKHRVLY